MKKFPDDHVFIMAGLEPNRLFPIEEVLEWQDYLCELKKTDPFNFMLIVEHPHVYTFDPTGYKCKRLFRNEAGEGDDTLPAALVPTKRGGSITYHGPGQLICYIILAYEDVGIRGPVHLAKIIDDILKETLLKFGIFGYTTKELAEIEKEGVQNQLFSQNIVYTNGSGMRKVEDAAQGLWVVTPKDEVKKIASRGLKILRHELSPTRTKHITQFGFSINVSTDLSYYEWIYPCGLDIRMTSILEATGKKIEMFEVARLVAEIMTKKFEEIPFDPSINLV